VEASLVTKTPTSKNDKPTATTAPIIKYKRGIGRSYLSPNPCAYTVEVIEKKTNKPEVKISTLGLLFKITYLIWEDLYGA
tara:strand:- start:573 stop:812 length:240 start_codon:yes stop_codon:yes gene_type:complete